MVLDVSPTDVCQNATRYFDRVQPAPRYELDDTPTMTPRTRSGTALWGNWPEFDRDSVSEHEVDLDDSFNSLYGVFRVGHYISPSGYPRQVFIKEYGQSPRYEGEGLKLKTGLREAAGLAGLEFLGVPVPRYALHPEEKWAAKLEIRGCSVAEASHRMCNRVSKHQLLDFAAANAMVGSWDTDPDDVFIGPHGRLWAVDLDSSLSDLTHIGDWGVNEACYERHLAHTRETAEEIGCTVSRDEIVTADSRLAQDLVDTGAVHVLEEVLGQYSSERAAMIRDQIVDFESVLRETGNL